MSTCSSSAATAEVRWTEGMVHVAVRAQLRADDWTLVAGQYPGGSDDELWPLNVVDPGLARDGSPDPRRHSLGKLVPDVVALGGRVLLLVEAKVAYSEDDRAKLDELLTLRHADLLRALREFGRLRGFPALTEPEELLLVPGLAFVRGEAPEDVRGRFAVIRPRDANAAVVELPPGLRRAA